MVQTQGQRGDLHQNSHPYKINRDRGIELLAESMDANLELASDDPWAPFQETENWSVWKIRVVISGMNSCSHWFEVCRLRLSSATSDLTIPIESLTIKSTVRIQYKHLVLSTSIALLRKRPPSALTCQTLENYVFISRNRSLTRWSERFSAILFGDGLLDTECVYQDTSPLSPPGIELRFIVLLF